jgi:hypothetical protein
MARGKYSWQTGGQSISTAITIVEITAPSTAVLVIHRAWCEQSGSTTSAMNRIQILRKSATITGTASPPSILALDGSASASSTAKWKATAEGTDGNVLIEDSYNVLNGWLYLPVPEERIIVPPSGIIALKFPAAPANSSYSYGMVFEELG